ncbi:DUF1697 domain-containing protein [Sphingomonas sp. DT-204]|uniref:DUF1697 domain-containing protein n=1 Tax=Sphingomonas sp. DT-204 TaxID=3396166 RepID=UPI003F1DC73C
MRWAVLPEAVNAGRKLAMADLRAFLADQGMSDVKTLLASGNAVFAAAMRRSRGRPSPQPFPSPGAGPRSTMPPAPAGGSRTGHAAR